MVLWYILEGHWWSPDLCLENVLYFGKSLMVLCVGKSLVSFVFWKVSGGFMFWKVSGGFVFWKVSGGLGIRCTLPIGALIICVQIWESIANEKGHN